MDQDHWIGVDVGTGSVRAGLMNKDGVILHSFTHAITIHNPKQNYYMQSSSEIWKAVCTCVRQVSSKSARIKGIGFDATCSMVVVGEEGQPLSVDPDDESSPWDIVMWMDHRAKDECDVINATAHPVLNYVGGCMSVEMQTPKLKWIKKHLPMVWKSATKFFDLPDYLTWRASGNPARSLCSTVCKWTYEVGLDGQVHGWNTDFYRQIGLGDLAEDHFEKLGQDVVAPGSSLGKVTDTVATELMIPSDVVVGASLIDAHAGALGMLVCHAARKLALPEEQIGLICGTSTCHMALSAKATIVPGIWGPYFSAVLPGLWLNEGGQTAVGSLIDHLLTSHPSYHHVEIEAKQRGVVVQQLLEEELEAIRLQENCHHVAMVTKNLHVWPDFHGNRAPLADPEMKGQVVGLTLDKSVQSLAKLYLAAIQAVAYGTKHIMEELESHGSTIRVATICGGLSKSNLFIQTNADVLEIPVVKPDVNESVLQGAAILGACASAEDDDLLRIIGDFQTGGKTFWPDDEVKGYHHRKYLVFRKMANDQLKYRKIMGTD